MADPIVRYETDGRVSLVTLNRPEKLNAISDELMRALMAAFRRADDDRTTHVVVLRAEGRSFCVGYDIGGGSEMADRWQDKALNWYDTLKECLELELMPWQLTKPVIASVQGHVLGGGCELALYSDLTIAADDAKFGEPEIRFSNSGPGFVLPWIVGPKRARELLYLGDMIDASTALEIGMVNRVVPRERLVEETLAYARRLAMVDAEALVMTKRALNRGLDAAGFRRAMEAGLDAIAPLYAAETEHGAEFKRIAERDGLGAALKWRSAHFKT
jgi:enoyl-CoA hydratase/carnithine racemase